MKPFNSLVRWLVLALALAAFAAVAAQAGAGTNDRAKSDVVSRYLRSHAARPDGRIGQLGISSTPSPDVFERYAAVHPYGVGLTALPAVAARGFRWGDYGAGVGTGVAAVLLLAGGLLVTPSRRKQRTQPAIGR